MKKKTGKAPKKNSERFERSDFSDFSAYSFEPAPRSGNDPYLRIRQVDREASKNYTKNEVRRRQNKKRKIKNKARNVLIILAVFIGFLALGITLSLTIFFKITDINVTGSSAYTAEEIILLSTIEKDDNLFLIDKNECITKLTEALPYIYDVKITRKLPATVNLEITDGTAAFAIENGDDSYILTDDRLKVLEAMSPEKPSGVIMITDTAVESAIPGYAIGFENEDVSQCILSLVSAIQALNMTEATSISSTDKNNNSIVYNNRITFKLGSCNNLESKINRGLTVCAELDKHNDSIRGTVNLSVDKQSYFTEE